MSRRLAAEIPRLCVEKLGNSWLLPALFALIRKISSRHPSGPELIRGSLNYMVLLGKQEKYAQAEALGEKLLSITTNNALAHKQPWHYPNYCINFQRMTALLVL